jgi:predicted nucleotidyltransferase
MDLNDFEKQLEQPVLFEKKDIEKRSAVSRSADVSKYQAKVDPTKTNYYTKVVEFTRKIRKNHGEVIKSVLIFGSAATGKAKKTSDVDVWIVFDDTSAKNTEDAMKLRSQIQLTATEAKDIHVQINGLTEFWNWMKTGSPELFNYLRVGLVIYDTGFIKPVQRMLNMGLFPPSEETVRLKIRSSQTIIQRVEANLKLSVFDLRYATTDICQAVVMHHYKETPDQRRMPDFLTKLVDEGKLESEYIDKFNELNKLWKDIDHKIVKKAEAKHLEKATELSEEIIERMKKLLPKELLDVDVPRLF